MSTLIVAALVAVATFALLQYEWRQIPKRIAREDRAAFVRQMIRVGASLEQAAGAFRGLQAPLERAGAAFKQLGVALSEPPPNTLRGPTPSLIIYDEWQSPR